MPKRTDLTSATLWPLLRREAEERKASEPALAAYLDSAVLERADLSDALAHMLSHELANSGMDADAVYKVIKESHTTDASLLHAAEADLMAIVDRDPAAADPLVPFLFFKGYQALQAWRTAHWLWGLGRITTAHYLQSRISRRFHVDIHPAAKIGEGIMIDHAHGIVVGETAEIANDVSLLHNVTLGGTGKQGGDRHPKIRTGVMIGAGAKVLGNIVVGEGARIAAGSVVLENVPAHVTVAGVPARIVGQAGCAKPSLEMDQMLSADCISI